MIKSLAIWATGLLGAFLLGLGLSASTEDAAPAGGFGAALLFICIRLWIGERDRVMPVYDLRDDRLE